MNMINIWGDEVLNDYEKRLIEKIQTIQKYDSWAVFADLMDCAAREIRLAMRDKPPEINDFDKKYDEREKQCFAEMIALLTESFEQHITEENRFFDVAGLMFHELNLGNKHAGQFFTPQHIADLMAECAASSDVVKDEIDKRGYFVVDEPACGAGATILGAATAIKKLGYNPQETILIKTSDIDRRCVNMAYVQFSLYGLPAMVTHADALTGKVWDRLLTPMYYLKFWKFMK